MSGSSASWRANDCTYESPGRSPPAGRPASGAGPLAETLGFEVVVCCIVLACVSARLTLTATYELQRRAGRFVLATMCIGVGQGIALALERV
ncbi:hypothetical protein KPG66_06270 [Mycetohabitans sp. B2]|uniref:Thiolase C-terminal domain-containing protein n=1 Tax=Mycetohabitans rhizoxinica TaxID=412963 RepID=A0ABZ2PZB7_9BURK|nr:hypothetical protein [Mycetohabitans sp. B2]